MPDEQEQEQGQEQVVEPEASEQEIEQELEREEQELVKPKPAFRPGEARTFLDRAWDLQYRIENRLQRIGKGRYARVVKMARKPEQEEFVRSAKVTAIGLMLIGLVGFLIFLLMKALLAMLNVK